MSSQECEDELTRGVGSILPAQHRKEMKEPLGISGQNPPGFEVLPQPNTHLFTLSPELCHLSRLSPLGARTVCPYLIVQYLKQWGPDFTGASRQQGDSANNEN